MKIIITGATSFLGRAAYKCLVKDGHEVTALRHSFDEEQELLPANADVWLHFAWAGVGSAGRSDPAVQSFNVEMTEKAMEKAYELKCRRFVFAGSQAEYGHAQDGGPKYEYGETAPVSEYGKAKLKVLEKGMKFAGEHDGISYVHMRLFSVYGPGDHGTSLVNTLVKGFMAGDSVSLGPCTQQWNYMYIEDAARAIALLCTEETSGIYNIAGEETKPLRDYVAEVHELLGNKGEAVFGSRADNAEGPADLSPDIARLKALGFSSKISFAEGIKNIESIYLQ